MFPIHPELILKVNEECRLARMKLEGGDATEEDYCAFQKAYLEALRLYREDDL